MIYLTQLIFIKEGKEDTFNEFENFAIPLLQKYGGEIIYRIRPSKNNFIDESKETPYEIHIISFNSNEDFKEFMNDKKRLEFIHLKNESIKSTILVKGEKL
jgi:uncharacterized protein (DUF1330 family)